MTDVILEKYAVVVSHSIVKTRGSIFCGKVSSKARYTGGPSRYQELSEITVFLSDAPYHELGSRNRVFDMAQ